ncbi:MAG: hypothetical protein GXX96_38260 [Planctomycetaceae bacterium]|nr:hypothetical protein [Planctomycetaceae bacterium]
MSDSAHPQEVVDQLLCRWDLQAGDTERVFGEIVGSPATMTVLGADPLALLFAFRIATPRPESVVCSEELESLIDDGAVDVSLVDGIAWLSLYRPDCETSDSIGELAEDFAETLSQAGLALPAGCVSCGAVEDVQVLFADERCTRLCSRCIEERLDEQEKVQERLDRASSVHWAGLACAENTYGRSDCFSVFVLDLCAWCAHVCEGWVAGLPRFRLSRIDKSEKNGFIRRKRRFHPRPGVPVPLLGLVQTRVTESWAEWRRIGFGENACFPLQPIIISPSIPSANSCSTPNPAFDLPSSCHPSHTSPHSAAPPPAKTLQKIPPTME